MKRPMKKMSNAFNTSTYMKKQIITGMALALIAAHAIAQQLPLYNQYYAIPFLQNPSLAGNTDFANAALIHKSMWKDMPGAPVTSALTIESPIQEKNIGLGAVLFSDVTDITTRTGFSTSYSYKIKLNDNSLLRLGGSIGIIDTKIDFTRAVVKDANDPMLIAAMSMGSFASFTTARVKSILVSMMPMEPPSLSNELSFS